jgi:NTP pyrophosphatase (non-canonical NTP hydrolase)
MINLVEYVKNKNYRDIEPYKSASNLDKYQIDAIAQAIWPNDGKTLGLNYASLGMCSEAGEVAGKVKKIMRDYDNKISESTKKEIALENGDVLWYVALTAFEIGLTLQEIADMNIGKLEDRHKRGTIKGNGDNR